MDRPRTRYARSGEVAIAYQVYGSGEHDILLSDGPTTNVETVWTLPEAVRLFERLGRFARVIAFDRRDTGLSDAISDDLTLEAHADDALAVMDAVGAQRPVLLGGPNSSRSLALLAATRPNRVAGLIAFLPSARGSALARAEFPEMVTRATSQFEDYPDPVVATWAPRWEADSVRGDRLRRYFQTSATPRQAARLLHLALASDASEALPLVQAPTLVLLPASQQLVPVEAVQDFADLIPTSAMREIPGDAALMIGNDVDELADIVEEFVTGVAPVATSSRVLATVLFTDLVDSTVRAAKAGDRDWAKTLERHFDGARTCVAAHGGQTIKTTGDGILALFTGPAQGVRCAQTVIADARGLGLDVRTGLHTGEVERTKDDVAGLAVHLAARIASLARTGEILVSRTVRDLVIGSELVFTAHGEHELKGIPERWAVYAVA